MAVESSFPGHTESCLPTRPHYDTNPSIACSSTEKSQSSEAPEIGTGYFI
jgi:hypothetical protein